MLTEQLHLQDYLNLALITTAFFLRYLVFCSIVPMGCSRLTITLLSFSLALSAVLMITNQNGFSLASSSYKIQPGIGLWLNQALMGLKLALPFILVSCCVSFLATALEGVIGGGFMSLVSPWSRNNSSSLRTFVESWALGVALLPKQFEILVAGLFEDITTVSDWGDITEFSIKAADLISFLPDLVAKFGELVSGLSPLLLIYLFLDIATLMISKVLNRGMFQGELGQLKGVVTLIILIELSKHQPFSEIF